MASVRFIVLLLLLPAAACANSGQGANRDSAEYQAGYSDGCATGGARASRVDQPARRDQALFDTSADYRAGWSSGYNVCGAGASPGRL
jgi:hypothetical protein